MRHVVAMRQLPSAATITGASALALCLALAAMLSAQCAPARADVFGPISLISQSSTQQVDYAHDPAISGDGRYVAFDGSFGGIAGVWRRDLATGQVQPVAVEDPGDPAVSVPDAELPSISASGRYVSFTTTARLDPLDDTNEGPDVYVRDMEEGIDEAGAFTLASAVTGSAQGLAYEPSWGLEPSFEAKHYGSVASGRTALSADGRMVAFVTSAVSDLDGPGTPALQVAVRDLNTNSTRLVSAAYDPARGKPVVDPTTGGPDPVSGEEGGFTYGAVYSPSLPPPAFNPPAAYGLQSPLGASISGDGSTVAWMGQDIGAQTQTLSDEALPPRYSEPLWRRIADGPEAPTRPITGGSDPANLACAASGETILPSKASLSDPCQGPFATEALGVWTSGTGDPVPQLSADGATVAFLASAPPVGGSFGEDVLNRASDLYVADMHAGLTRVQALRPLTELASGNAQEPATTAPIVDLGISPDGSQVAFTSQRTAFPLGAPTYVSAPAATPGMVELFDVDLANDTLTHVTQGFAGEASAAPHGTEVPGQDPYRNTNGALSPSFSDGGDTLAFSSTAANLVYGDGNTPQQQESPVFDGSDAFVVPRIVFDSTPTTQFVSNPPGIPPLTDAWRLGVTAFSRRDGSVVLEIEVPSAGTLRAGARGAVRVRATRPIRAEHSAAHGRVSTHGRLGRGTAMTVATRTVATRTVQAHAAGLVVMALKLTKPYAALAGKRGAGGLSAMADVSFSTPGRPTLHGSVTVTFQRSAHSARRPRPRRGRTTVGDGRSGKGVRR